jgi:hypothetical protein
METTSCARQLQQQPLSLPRQLPLSHRTSHSSPELSQSVHIFTCNITAVREKNQTKLKYLVPFPCCFERKRNRYDMIYVKNKP